eukprot:TRINITY_DN2703_c7_g1_i1.p1 TRINITY_DN2703_c7_g1~~TRINITY_DN2703_c7_g1_i1.p1  ORF type:complete len:148 (+),score=13.53 TRINITY_DN2703_c7_g1_i1:66-446(+)
MEHSLLSDKQLQHQQELKGKFCQASEMITKLFLGNSQSYHNGKMQVLDDLGDWVALQEDVICKTDLLRILERLTPPPSAAGASKEQCSFSRKRAQPAEPTQSHQPQKKKTIAHAAFALNRLSLTEE